MENGRSVVLTGAGALLVALCAACSRDGGTTSGPGGAPIAAGSHAGIYEVPIAAPELANAAVYEVAEVEWTVTNGTAKLDYALPLGLVGKEVKVEFVGPIGASATKATLSGPAGTAECTLAGTAVSCLENMAGLHPLEPNYAVIEQLAQVEYGGPAAHRLDVAKQFANDPIGIVKFDVQAPVANDDDDGPSDTDDG
jgi:hypothetical protein